LTPNDAAAIIPPRPRWPHHIVLPPPCPTPPNQASARTDLEYGVLPGLIGYQLRMAQIALFKDFAQGPGAEDVTPGLFGVLVIIEANPDLKQSDLARATHLDRSTVVTVIDNLEKRGLVERRVALHDRRSNAIRLTEAGGRPAQKAQAPGGAAREAPDAELQHRRARPASSACCRRCFRNTAEAEADEDRRRLSRLHLALRLPGLREAAGGPGRQRHAIRYKPVLFAALLKHHGQLGPAEIAAKRDWTYRQVQWLAHGNGLRLDLPAAHPFNPLASAAPGTGHRERGRPRPRSLCRHLRTCLAGWAGRRRPATHRRTDTAPAPGA
jgi:DNA-binding MarR family transcriptional regulator